MAARINTKLLILILTICGVLAIGVGGAAFWALKTNPGINERRGDEAMAEGNFRVAKDEYAKACNKAPSDLRYLAKLEEALTSIMPQTPSEANELYGLQLVVMHTRVRIRPSDGDFQQALIDELALNARFDGRVQSWQQVAELAENAIDRVPPTDPRHNDFQRRLFEATIRSASLLTQTEKEKLRLDIETYLRSNATDGDAHALLIEYLWQRADEKRLSGDLLDAQTWEGKTEQALENAKVAGAESLRLSNVRARYIGTQLSRGSDRFTEADYKAAVDELFARADASDDVLELRDIARGLSDFRGREGVQRGQEILARILKDTPGDLITRWVLGNLHFDMGEFEVAEDEARAILDSEGTPTSFQAQYRFWLQQQAAKMLFDIAYRNASPSEPQRSKDMENARALLEKLKTLVPNASDNLLVEECEAWLAIQDKNYARAAAKFGKVLDVFDKSSASPSRSVLLGAAESFERTNARTRAIACLRQIIARAPNDVAALEYAARLELADGDIESARRHVDQVLELDENRAAAKELLSRIEDLETGGERFAEVDIALSRADQEVRQGNVSEGRRLLIEAHEKYPDDRSVFNALVTIEMQAGLREEASARLAAMLEKHPGDSRLKDLQQFFNEPDEVKALRKIVEADETDPTRVAVRLYTGFRQRAEALRSRAAVARADGRREDAERDEVLARRFDEEADIHRDVAIQIAPANPDLLQQRFLDALSAGDLTSAREIAQRARELNADEANGLLYQARLELYSQDWRSLVQTLREATTTLPNNVWVWRTLGLAQSRLGQTQDAIVSYEEALRRNASDAATIEPYVRLLANVGSFDAALAVLRGAMQNATLRSYDPLRESWLDLEAEKGSLFKAIEQRRERYARYSQDVTNALKLAGLFGKYSPPREAIRDLRGNPISERDWAVLTVRERDDLVAKKKAEWVREAQSIFADVESGPRGQSLAFAMYRAFFQRDMGKPDDGLNTILTYVSSLTEEERSAQTYIVTAQFMTSIGRTADAEKQLLEGMPYQSEDVREVDQALAVMYSSVGDFGQALPHFQRVAEIVADGSMDGPVIECLLRLGRLDEAQAAYDELARKRSGADFAMELMGSSISANRAEILLANGDTEAADRAFKQSRNAIERAIQLSPSDPLGHVRLARSIYQEYLRSDPRQKTLMDQAEIALSKAFDLNASYNQAIQLRIQFMLEGTPPDFAGAARQAMALLDKSPRDSATRKYVIETLLRGSDFNRAETVAKEGIQLDPSSELWYVTTAQILEMQGKWANAAAMRWNAFQVSNSSALLPLWSEDMLRTGQIESVKTVVAELGSRPNVVEAVPALQAYYARALMITGEKADAIEQIRGAYEQYQSAAEATENPGLIVDWYSHLRMMRLPAAEVDSMVMELTNNKPGVLQTYYLADLLSRAEPGSSRAEELYREALTLIGPDDKGDRAKLYIGIGRIYWSRGNYPASRDAYQQAVDSDPDDHSARNDIAFLMADKLDQAEAALPHALEAVRMQPNHPSYLDTLGTVYLRLKRYEEARDALQKSIDINPNAENKLHMAEVLHATGQDALARRTLNDALQLSPTQELKTQIERLLADINP